jgi:hypothetical protein
LLQSDKYEIFWNKYRSPPALKLTNNVGKIFIFQEVNNRVLFLFVGKTPKGVKKKPRRRHKKGKGSPGGVGPNKKNPGNSSMAARTEITRSMHLSVCISVMAYLSFLLNPSVNLILNHSIYSKILLCLG